MSNKRRNKIQSEHLETRGKNTHINNEKLKSPRVNCQKKSVFTKDSIKYIYKNYHDFSSSTVDTIFEGYINPNRDIINLKNKTKKFESECERNRSVKDHLIEKLTKDAYNYEYAQYMRPYLDASVESCHCEPIYSDIYFNNIYPPQYVADYYSYCPEYYPHEKISRRKSHEKINLKKRAKTIKKSKRSPVYLTDTSTEALEKRKPNKKSVTSCGNQTDFTRKNSNTATQTDERRGKIENILSFFNLREIQIDTFWSLFGHYTKYIFLATLSFNLIRLYRRM